MRRRHTGTATRHLSDFTLPQTLALRAGWNPSPFHMQLTGWATWPDFLGAYGSVRDELRARHEGQFHGRPVFAECVREASISGGGIDAGVAAFRAADAAWRDHITAASSRTKENR